MKRREFTLFLSGTALGSLSGLAVSLSGCATPRKRTEDRAAIPTDDDKLVDREALRTMADRLSKSGANIHSVLVVHRGMLVFERYLPGTDEVPGYLFGRRFAQVEFDAATLHDMKSVSKSIASLAVGIALDRGLIRSIDEPILGFFPELSDMRNSETERILLRHALSMTMGLEWIEATPETGNWHNDETRMRLAQDPARFVLSRPMVAPPGQEFHYNTGALALVSAIVHRATGQPLDAFARANLLEPLGIQSGDWARYRGETDAGGGLRLRPREMAKIGQLVLDGGRWNGSQIVSKGWIDASTAPVVKASDDEYYGYLWWLGRARFKRKDVLWIGALGRGGQSIRIVPELDLVVVVTAGYYQDYSPQAFKTQYGVFTDVIKSMYPPA